MNPPRKPLLRLQPLALLFVKLGAIGFGGGMAVLALMEEELVRRRKLMDPEELLHGLALGQILGSFATNAAYFVGHRFFGFLGGMTCAVAFMAPSVALVIGLSWLYFTFHALPALNATLKGLGPVVIALILGAAWSMGRKALRSWQAGLLAAVALALALLRVNAPVIMGLGAVVGLVTGKAALSRTPSRALASRPVPALLALGGAPLAAAPVAASLLVTAWTFIKMGFIFFGGGFVLVPVLHQKLVVALGWLTPREFIDGVAISNLTPGPIAVLATFAGYRLQGVPGALVATAALFLPALALMALLTHFYSRMRDLRHAQNLLAGLVPVMVGLILAAALLLAPGALHGLPGFGLFGLALVLLVRFRWHPAFVLGLGALLGMAGWVH
ncbi:chromate efflux transporter [Mesoterricola silvestris]|uniref:Chromate transporter n=1 Tax=Mesoterricola silvestris TaxID=2927979 RepID=A0AA48GPA7_9BACT|nr:chromate efflux transporter [Mesoterricola silvestris]BDU71507.1 hypothetical protein METEAL_06810 [Mesoterricola silvestris]